MDDIQFWLYLVFGLIYFVGRFFKKKNKREEVLENEDQPTATTNKPQRTKTFEELLREFSGEQDMVPEAVEEAVRPIEKSKPALSSESVFEEGTTRRFSDEESKRVYEESVKRAEGFDIEFAPDEHFRSKIQREATLEVTSKFASSIREGLSDPEEAKKAVIYAEILNRKY